MKFCICFFGVIGISLKYTIESIKKNIFDILKERDIEYDVFIHNNKISHITYLGTNKKYLIDNLLYKKLNPKKYIETPQIDFDKKYNWEMVFRNGDIHQNNFFSLRNAIREIYSIKKVTQLWKNKEEYDLYLYLRPDLLYINKLDIELILQNINKKNLLFTPNWDKHYGLNDRLYFGKYNTILKIANRIDMIPELITKTNIAYNAERFLKQIVNKYKINTIDIQLKGLRVRANGIIQETGKQLHLS